MIILVKVVPHNADPVRNTNAVGLTQTGAPTHKQLNPILVFNKLNIWMICSTLLQLPSCLHSHAFLPLSINIILRKRILGIQVRCRDINSEITRCARRYSLSKICCLCFGGIQKTWCTNHSTTRSSGDDTCSSASSNGCDEVKSCCVEGTQNKQQRPVVFSDIRSKYTFVMSLLSTKLLDPIPMLIALKMIFQPRRCSNIIIVTRGTHLSSQNYFHKVVKQQATYEVISDMLHFVKSKFE